MLSSMQYDTPLFSADIPESAHEGEVQVGPCLKASIHFPSICQPTELWGRKLHNPCLFQIDASNPFLRLVSPLNNPRSSTCERDANVVVFAPSLPLTSMYSHVGRFETLLDFVILWHSGLELGLDASAVSLIGLDSSSGNGAVSNRRRRTRQRPTLLGSGFESKKFDDDTFYCVSSFRHMHSVLPPFLEPPQKAAELIPTNAVRGPPVWSTSFLYISSGAKPSKAKEIDPAWLRSSLTMSSQFGQGLAGSSPGPNGDSSYCCCCVDSHSRVAVLADGLPSRSPASEPESGLESTMVRLRLRSLRTRRL
ncbi:hypothetical protein GGR53DRAFT_424946 [Hypoxylon sp. FL1150]|nr:hypothetical protein GGR53DRAFT_424946 [Hypoxylon sp. FL1150]